MNIVFSTIQETINLQLLVLIADTVEINSMISTKMRIEMIKKFGSLPELPINIKKIKGDTPVRAIAVFIFLFIFRMSFPPPLTSIK